ncbi:triose-phosphate isomerase [Candidatus Saccharibacteria bacterium RIFCSPLOWO2_01_FULL_48_13]|nr:MAG: triose-phosphate isomerase [Candidatus Saccharibacteria bacterium RIFCSPHIGHO2_01_FULL_48_12]OGL36607.1 MAG: triose-phosphate isomerase [Candidatus Saccharibacteria bacterium RIFCSPHIGHO2_12_FULL_48_21]OGL36953.1 MAG: triose-phosphate isomerase [Candidatus Saccharibacteria bacterium RIFCSPLOWO2_01_FULL_48_13]
MRKILIVGNWKMHLNASQASLLAHRLHERIMIHRDIEVVLAPPMLTLQPLSVQIDRRKFRLAAQNAYFVDEGAFTGEVSFTMLRDLVHYVIVGHSERRQVFGEDLDMIRDKMAAAFRNEITPLLCVGETKHERSDGETKQVLHDQLMTALHNLTAREVGAMVIAYEPVWAIGTGEVAKPDEVAEAVSYIRSYVGDVFGSKASKGLRILYGGSLSPEFVHGFLDVDGVDGFLVGGASLNYHSFAAIVAKSHSWQRAEGELA